MSDTLRRRVLGLTLISFLLVFSTVAFAQAAQSALVGTIHDSTGAVVPDAKVTLTNNGTNQVLKTTSTADGSFNVPLINNGTYTVVVEKDGFNKAVYNDVIVLPGQKYSLTVNLRVGAKNESVEVIAGQDLINTASSEVAGTVDQNQILQLPLNGRNPIELIRNQAGVPGILDATRNSTTINGGRPGWTQTSQDGINVNDNFIRTNSNDFIANRPTSDTVAEFSIITSNPGADSVGGTSQVKMATPAGTNAFHGGVYEYNRNSALAANEWGNKTSDPVIPKDKLNLNQFGGKIGGPIIKDKLFFFGMYEGYRYRSQATSTNIIPASTDYLNGTYKVRDSGGTVRTLNVLNLINQKIASTTLTPLSIDPQVKSQILDRFKSPSLANSTNCSSARGSGAITYGLNLACTNFQQTNPTNRDQEAFRFDYNATQKHSFEFVFSRFTDFDARTDIDNINATPLSSLSTNNKMFVGAWRWTVTSTLVNEVRAGDNTSTVPFVTGRTDPSYFLAGTYPGSGQAPVLSGIGLTAPDAYFMPQGRAVTTRQYTDTANWSKGKHNIAFGGSYNHVAPHTYNYANVPPTYTFGLSASNPATSGYRLSAADLQSLTGYTFSTTNVNAMNTYAGFLSGYVSSVAQGFQAKDTTAGFVAGYPNIRKYEYTIWSPYIQDSWKIRSNVTVNAGLKWEYWSPLHELSNLALLPMGENTQAALLDPNGKVGPINGGFWKPDYKQFAPNFGIAWDPFKDGKTVIRGGWSMSFVNEDMVTASNNVLSGNFGLSGTTTWSDQAIKFGNGVPAIPAPAFLAVRSYSDQSVAAGNGTGTAFGFQNDLKTPYAHQLTFEIQREVKWNTAIYARYVGTLGMDLWRGVDWGQQLGPQNAGFVADFNRARNNMFNCDGDPYGTECSAAQPLQWFPTFDPARTANPGNLLNQTLWNYVYYGQPGALVNYYIQHRGNNNNVGRYTDLYPNAVQFMPNPGIYASDELINGATSNYHAFQFEVKRAMKNGFGFQANYTFSKLLSDANGNTQNRFEPFLDNNNRRLDYGRSEYDLNHVINANIIYELPFGRGKHFLGGATGVVDKVIGGWTVSSITRIQSGNPFSINSGYMSLNRRGTMPAYTTLSHSQVKDLLGMHVDESGQRYWINPSVLNPNGTYACGEYDPLTYDPTFDGQVFYNPLPFTTGNMRRLAFNGPGAWNMDMSFAKKTRVTERVNTEFRADFFNFLNRTTYAIYGDFNINNSGFGQINDALPKRQVQLSLRVNF